MVTHTLLNARPPGARRLRVVGIAEPRFALESPRQRVEGVEADVDLGASVDLDAENRSTRAVNDGWDDG